MSDPKLSRAIHTEIGELLQGCILDSSKVLAHLRNAYSDERMPERIQKEIDRALNGLILLRSEMVQQAIRDHGDVAWSGQAYKYNVEVYSESDEELEA